MSDKPTTLKDTRAHFDKQLDALDQVKPVQAFIGIYVYDDKVCGTIIGKGTELVDGLVTTAEGENGITLVIIKAAAILMRKATGM